MRPTTEVSAEVEFAVLTSEEGRALLREVAAVPSPGPSDLARWRRSANASHVSAALRLADGRRRGAAKFTRADRMWFEPTALEQSTPEPVAGQKARRFAGADVADLCCGLGGDAIALAGAARRVVAVDRDLGMLRRVLWNARAYGVEDRLLAVQARAETFPVLKRMLVHVDPDRRSTGGLRARNVADYVPGLDVLRAIRSQSRGGAIKLGPASDFAGHFAGPDVEAEIVSLDGECKEATIWFGDLATCRRRATSLPSGSTWTDRDGPPGTAAIGDVGGWVHEPDPALVRSGLLDGFALAHGRCRFLVGIDLLTGADRLDSGLIVNFAVHRVMPLDMKLIRREMRREGLDAVAIKPRGLQSPTPEDARRMLRHEGGEPITVFLLNGRQGSRAILARRA